MMALGPTVEWQEIALLAGVLTAAAAPIVWVWRDGRSSIRDLHSRVDKLKEEVAADKLEAAKTFVSAEAVARVEKRLVASEERMAAAIERLGERIDRAMETLIERRRSRSP